MKTKGTLVSILCSFFLFIASSSSYALEEILVRGRPIPSGFYNYSSSHFTSDQMTSLFLSTSYRGGPSLLESEIAKWNTKCGAIGGRINHEHKQCEKDTRADYVEMVKFCATLWDRNWAIEGNADAGFFGGSITTVWTQNNQASCSTIAGGKRDEELSKCAVDYTEQVNATRDECKGAMDIWN